MLEAYRAHVAERAALGIPPLPLSKQQVAELVELLKNPPAGEEAFLVELLTYRVPAGVDDAAKVKAEFLAKVAKGEEACALVSRAKATELLGTMLGGFNIKPLIDLLADAEVGAVAAEGLKKTLLMFDYFHDVKELAAAGNANAKAVMQSWADAEWFTSRPEVPASQKLTVFKVTGETNTDDLSPAPDAWSRPDIPLHALAMLKNPRPGITPEEPGVRGPVKFLEELRAKGNLVAYVGDVVGTGSSRKSATNSVLWFTGEDIPFVPNKRFGGVCLGSKIAPIFFNTMEDAGALPIEIDVGQMDMGDEIELKVDHATGKVTALKNGAVIAESQLKTLVILDEVRAGGRIPLIIGRGLTAKAREFLGLPASTVFRLPTAPAESKAGFTLAQWLPWGSRDYWILLTIVVVLRGSLAQTLERRNARVLGTLLGSGLAVGLLALHPPAAVLLLAVVAAQGVAHAFVVRHYTTTAVAGSVLGLVLAHLLHSGGHPAFDFIERVGDTLLGAGIAWAFSYVLPSWERHQIAGTVRRVCRAMARHAQQSLALATLAEVTGQPELTWRLARRETYDALSALVQASNRALVEPRAVRPPLAALEQLQGHGYQLLGQLSAIQSILLLRRPQLQLEAVQPALNDTARAIEATLDLSRPWQPVATAPDEAEDESPRLSAVPEDLPDPFEPHSNAWLLRRLALARRQAGDLRAATDHVLAELDGGPPSRA